jgi:aryl-alcohol dehydrogenase-like predicted oxidoreductase
MPLDHFVSLGRSGLKVSPHCLGAMTFGEDWGFGTPVKDAEAIIDRYLALGGNFIDTANAYTRGHSEKILGDHLGCHASKRERVVLATKFFSGMHQGDPNSGGAGRKAMVAACEHSLRRLRTDWIDLYWMHCWDPSTPIEETMRGLDDLVAAGKVRYVGFSDTPAWKCAEAQVTARMRGWAPLVALQIEYSLLERTVEGELVPMAREMGLGITPWSPLKSGVLSGRFARENRGKETSSRGAWAEGALTEKAYDVIDLLRRIAKEAESTPARVALAWLGSRPGVSSIIIGARTMAQLEDNVAALELRLSPGHLAELHALSKPALAFPHDFVANAGPFARGGCTVDGTTHAVNPLAPQDDSQRY